MASGYEDVNKLSVHNIPTMMNFMKYWFNTFNEGTDEYSHTKQQKWKFITSFKITFIWVFLPLKLYSSWTWTKEKQSVYFMSKG